MRLAGSMSAEANARYTSALVWALSRCGRAKEGADIADREGMLALHRVAATAHPAAQSASYGALAEVYLFDGRLRDGVACARFAHDYAREAQDEAVEFRALSVLTAALALGGEISLAKDAIASARALGEPRGWTDEPAAALFLLGEVLIRARSADAAGIAECCQALARVEGHDVVVRSITRFCNVILSSVVQDNRELVATARLLVQGADAAMCPPYLREMAISMESVGHIHLGAPGEALHLLADRTSPEEHSVCFELMRATAYLQLGEFRKVIESTEGCVRHQIDHSILTLVSVLLRRALAYEALGMTSLADEEYSRANHLALANGLVSATLGVSIPALTVLFERMAVNEPAFAAEVLACLPKGYRFPDPPALDFEAPQLTPREAVLAEWLMTDKSLREIAAELHVSINTVKSQVASLYRKLKVSSREEATLHLRRTGLYHAPDQGKRELPSAGSVPTLPTRRGCWGPSD